MNGRKCLRDSDESLSLEKVCELLEIEVEFKFTKRRVAKYFRDYCEHYSQQKLLCTDYIKRGKYILPKQIAKEFINYMKSDEVNYYFGDIITICEKELNLTKTQVRYYFNEIYLKKIRRVEKDSYKIKTGTEEIMMKESEAEYFFKMLASYYLNDKTMVNECYKYLNSGKKLKELQGDLINEKTMSEFMHLLIHDKRIEQILDYYKNKIPKLEEQKDDLILLIMNMSDPVDNFINAINKNTKTFVLECFCKALIRVFDIIVEDQTVENENKIIKDDELGVEQIKYVINKNINDFFEKINNDTIK